MLGFLVKWSRKCLKRSATSNRKTTTWDVFFSRPERQLFGNSSTNTVPHSPGFIWADLIPWVIGLTHRQNHLLWLHIKCQLISHCFLAFSLTNLQQQDCNFWLNQAFDTSIVSVAMVHQIINYVSIMFSDTINFPKSTNIISAWKSDQRHERGGKISQDINTEEVVSTW